MSAIYAARTFLTLTAVVVAFQLALASGAPWGELTMGGARPHWPKTVGPLGVTNRVTNERPTIREGRSGVVSTASALHGFRCYELSRVTR
jgi:hypothetical protein